jgi:hypothetical protein
MKRIAAVIYDSTESKMLRNLSAVKTHKCVQELQETNVDIFNFQGSESEVLKRINSELENYDFIHILMAGDVVLPDFYISANVALEHSRKDYCFSHHYSFDNCELVLDSIHPCQFVIKRWVLEELSVCKSFNQLYGKITEQYQGCEVPAILVLS